MSERPLGKNQLERLLSLASPSMLLVVGSGKLDQSLVKRGMLKPKKPDQPMALLQITPLGLRTLATALQQGLLDQFFAWPKDLR